MINTMSWLEKREKNVKHSSTIEAVEATLSRIQKNPSVRGVMVINADGMVEKSTVPVAMANTYVAMARKMILMSRICLKNMDPRDELNFVRVRTKGSEIMIAPDRGYLLIVIQDIEPYESKVVRDDSD